MSAVRSSKMTNNLKSSTYISIRSGQYFYWPDDLVSWFLKLECLRLQKKQNTSLPHGGVLQEQLGGGVRHSSWNRYPISDQNLWISLPYFRPDQKFDLSDLKRDRSAWQAVTASTRLASVNIKREIVLSPNDEEVASSKNIPNSRLEYTNHTLFQTKMAKKP